MDTLKMFYFKDQSMKCPWYTDNYMTTFSKLNFVFAGSRNCGSYLVCHSGSTDLHWRRQWQQTIVSVASIFTQRAREHSQRNSHQKRLWCSRPWCHSKLFLDMLAPKFLVYRKIPSVSPGLIDIFKHIFGGLYSGGSLYWGGGLYSGGLYSEGVMS